MADFWNERTPYGRAVVNWCGYYKFESPIWVHFFPYVILFSLAVVLLSMFRTKLKYEEKGVEATLSEEMENSVNDYIRASVHSLPSDSINKSLELATPSRESEMVFARPSIAKVTEMQSAIREQYYGI